MKNEGRALILGLCFAALLLTSVAQRQESEPEAILLTLQPAQNITVPMYGMEPTGSYEDRAAAAESLRMRVDEYALFR